MNIPDSPYQPGDLIEYKQSSRTVEEWWGVQMRVTYVSADNYGIIQVQGVIERVTTPAYQTVGAIHDDWDDRDDHRFTVVKELPEPIPTFTNATEAAAWLSRIASQL